MIGDGCLEPAEETLDLDYPQSRGAAMSVPNRGLITFEEEKRINKGQFENDDWVWVESGENPSSPRFAYWDNGQVNSIEDSPELPFRTVGSRRVLRIQLKLGA